MAGTTRVVLAVATYRRAELLRDLLPLLVAEVDELEDEARVVVVDNDPDGSARAVVERLGSPSVDYYLEPRPGIAAARNRALEESAGAEALVFIDDDERPGEAWLQTLVAAWKEWRCAAVAGPVVSLFEGSVDSWVETCSTFRRPRRASGTIMAGAATSNLLLDVGQLNRLGLRFDDRFGLTGGSDTMLTRRLTRLGGEIRWCDEAAVTEAVPPERANRRWALARTRRTGNVWSRVALELAESPGERLRTRTRLTVRGAYRVVWGSVLALLGVLTRDVAKRADGELEVCTGVGVLRGAYGHLVTEYHREGTT